MNRLLQWFYGTYIGAKYLEFLLWYDEKKEPTPQLTRTELQQVVVEAQKFAYREGLSQMKRNIHKLLRSKTQEEYEKVLGDIENLVDHAKKDEDDLTKLRETLYKSYIRTSGRDINSPTEHAKMVDQRIKDYKELHRHQEKRNMLRKIRKLRQEGKVKIALKLQKEFEEKYVRRK